MTAPIRCLATKAVEAIGPALEWLEDEHGIPFALLEGFLYPGHRKHRMHTVPERKGEALISRLLQAVIARRYSGDDQRKGDNCVTPIKAVQVSASWSPVPMAQQS